MRSASGGRFKRKRKADGGNWRIRGRREGEKRRRKLGWVRGVGGGDAGSGEGGTDERTRGIMEI